MISNYARSDTSCDLDLTAFLEKAFIKQDLDRQSRYSLHLNLDKLDKPLTSLEQLQALIPIFVIEEWLVITMAIG